MSCDAAALPAYPAVQAALAGIQAEHGVHIPLAVESGSRAWGFASLDSDYDAWFVYVRSAGRRVTPWPVPPHSRSSPRMWGPRLPFTLCTNDLPELNASLGPRMRGDERGWDVGEAREAAAALYRATVERLDAGVDR